MTIHARVHHPDVVKTEFKFRMIPLRRITKPLERQISEALLIANNNADILLNRAVDHNGGVARSPDLLFLFFSFGF